MAGRRWRTMFAVVISFAMACSLFIPVVGQAGEPIRAGEFEEYQIAEGKYGMVSTSHQLATEVGADILQQGGNAVDAAVAVQLVLNVVEPMMSGIGGGGFMMVYEAEADEVTIINSRERAPAGAEPDMFLNDDGGIIPFPERSTSGDAVGVPGTLLGLTTALDEWGTRPMHYLIQPAIHLAEKGFEVDQHLADSIEAHQDKLLRTAASDVFLPDGKPLQAGDHLVQKDLAKTLKLIRKSGSDAIYGGKVGEAIARTVQQFDGSMTIADLCNYEITVDEPVWGSYKEYDIATMPPPSSGGITLLQMMKLLEEFDLQNYDPYAADYYHLLTEAMHLAYADRGAFMGDPEFVDVPTSGLLNPEYVAERRALINPEMMTERVEPGDPWAYEQGEADYEIRMEEDDRPVGQTTHFTLTDRWGNVVSYTSTIEQLFGTGIMVPGYGLMLNNELTDFSARPGGPNEVQPHKRPLSSMTPTIVFKDGEPYMALGSPGGMTIITSVLQVALNSIEHDMTLPDAIAAPRIFSNTPAANVRWEHGIAEEIRADLQERGHPLTAEPQFIGNVQSIWMDPEQDLYQGVADFRRDGAATGVDRPRMKKH